MNNPAITELQLLHVDQIRDTIDAEFEKQQEKELGAFLEYSGLDPEECSGKYSWFAKESQLPHTRQAIFAKRPKETPVFGVFQKYYPDERCYKTWVVRYYEKPEPSQLN